MVLTVVEESCEVTGNDDTVVVVEEKDKEYVAGTKWRLRSFKGGGWERLLMSSLSLSSSTVVSGCWRETGGQGWLGRRFTWNRPLHWSHVFLFLVRPSSWASHKAHLISIDGGFAPTRLERGGRWWREDTWEVTGLNRTIAWFIAEIWL